MDSPTLEQQYQQALAHYADVLQNLSVDTLIELSDCCSENVVFKDPFNSTHGRKQYLELLRDMFARLDNVSFEVQDQEATSKSGYLTWVFSASSSATGPISVEGMSRIVFDQEGKVQQHYDYWDGSQIMEGIPVFGAVVRYIKKRAAYHA